jgi:hypothetical protein
MVRAMGWRALSTSSPQPAPASESWLTLHNLRGQANGNSCHLDGRATALTPGQAYMHNGYFKSLKEVVHFYNTRDTLGPCGPGKIEKVTCWPRPEVPQSDNKTTGNLSLSEEEEDQLVAFLKTLADGYTPPAAKNLR